MAILLGGCVQEERAEAPDAGDTAADVLLADADGAHGRLVIAPESVDFGRVAAGTTVEQTVRLQNSGTAPLTIENVQLLSESGEFALSAEDLALFPVTVEPDGVESAAVRVTFSSRSGRFSSATLVVVSNDPLSPETRVGLEANGRMPCIAVDGEEGIELGERTVNETHRREVSITNCSDPNNGETLIVDAIEFAESGGPTDGRLRLDFEAAFLPLELAAGRSAEFGVLFEPVNEGELETAVLEIRSNDPARPELKVEVRGTGSDNTCPTVSALCSVRDSGMSASSELNVRNLETLDCTAASSFDPDGEIVEYHWEVVERPAGSTSRFDDSADETPSLFVDLVGRYVIELNATDDDGVEACERSRVVVSALSGRDILVQLTWDTPGDESERDTGFGVGADVDLHLLHPNGCWEDNLWDAHWRSNNPNWGNPEQTDDDPSIDIDHTDGAGPENVSLSNPESGVTYRVGVHYWNDHGFGPSTSTLRVFLYGTLVHEAEKLLETRDAFWHAVNIEWPSGAVAIVDDLYGSIDDARCP